MSRDHTISRGSETNRIKRYEEQFDKTLKVGAYCPANSSPLDTHVSRAMSPDLSDPRSSTSTDSKGSQLSQSRRLRKKNGRIDLTATVPQSLGQEELKQEQRPSFDQNPHALPSATDDRADESKNDSVPKRWFTISKRKRPARFDGTKDEYVSDSPKPSSDLSVISEKELPETKRSRFGWLKRSRHDRPCSKLRKSPPPKETVSNEVKVKQDVRRANKTVRKRFGLRRVRFQPSTQTLRAAVTRDLYNGVEEDFCPIAERMDSPGSLREVVVDEAVVFDLSNERDPRARALAQRWVESRRERLGTVEGQNNDNGQETVVTEQIDATQTVEDAQPSLTAVEKVQLETPTQRTEVKTERKSRFYEHLSIRRKRRSRFYEHLNDSNDDDFDIRDYSDGPYASNITEYVSRFLAPTNYRQELTVVNPDEPIGEDAQQRRDEVNDVLQRLRDEVGAASSNENRMNSLDAQVSRTTGPKSGRCQLKRTQSIRRPGRALSPIPEAESPVPTDSSVDYPEEPTGEEAQQCRDGVHENVRQPTDDGTSGSFNQDTIKSQNTHTPQTVKANSVRCQLRRTQAFRRPRCPLPPIPKTDPHVPIPDSSVAEQASPVTEQEQSSPATADSDSDTASSSDYVSCRSSASTPETERCSSAEEAILDIGIARTQSFTKVLEPNIRSISILGSKGKEREERADTPMTSPKCSHALPNFQREHIPWWEATPSEPKILPPKFACGPSVMTKVPEAQLKKERPRAPTPEASVLLRSLTSPARPRSPKENATGKRQSLGRPGIAADLVYKYQHYDGGYVATSRRRAKSVSEEVVGVHLPVQEPVEIPRGELRRMLDL